MFPCCRCRHGAGCFRGAPLTLLLILLSHCAESCPELQEIDLSFCRGVTDNGLGRLADACAKLRRVHVWGCRKVTDKFISGTINEGLQVLGHE